MKRIVGAVLAIGVIVGAVAFSRQATTPSQTPSGLQVQINDRNPWTHLKLNNESDTFRFAIVSDRTGGHREKIFSRAVEQLNYMQPEFVLSVGDLIEGYTKDKDRATGEWKEFQNFTSRLDMPFFYVPGNHDLTNDFLAKMWEEKFGRRYYHFVYKNTLFLILCSEDPPGNNSISEDQQAYVKKALDENKDVSWTVVALHKPIWTANIEKNGWANVEKLLVGRNYTVFAGHVHRYEKFVRNGMNYYQLATTGGGSRLRGVKYGEFDHIVWVTMKKTGPILANVMLDGIYPENLKLPDTEEPVKQIDRKVTHPTKGYVYLDGVPVAGGRVSFYLKGVEGKAPRFAGDGLTEGDGSFLMSTYSLGDGSPVGEYIVTVTFDGIYNPEVRKKAKEIPEVYTKATTSPLMANVKTGDNEFTFDLKR